MGVRGQSLQTLEFACFEVSDYTLLIYLQVEEQEIQKVKSISDRLVQKWTRICNDIMVEGSSTWMKTFIVTALHVLVPADLYWLSP